MLSLTEKKALVRMNRALGLPDDEALIAEIQAEELAIKQKEQRQQEIKERHKQDFGSIIDSIGKEFSALLKEEKERSRKDQQLLVQFEEIFNNIESKKEEIVEAIDAADVDSIEPPIVADVVEEIEEQPLVEDVVEVQQAEEQKDSLIDKTVKRITENVTAPTVFVQPDPPAVDKELKNIVAKIKYLEGWVSKISMTGPGGGAVWLRDLDDIARSSVLGANDGDVLTYNSTTKKWGASTVSANGVVGTLHQVTTAGNTTNNSITANGVHSTHFAANLTAGYTVTTGEIAWNPADLTFDMGMANGVTLQVGQEQYIKIKAANTITNGQTVMFAGADGEHILALPCNARSVGFRPEYFIGIATQSISKNGFGYVTTFGKVHDVNTLAWSEGSILYVDPDTVGGLTSTEPADINIMVAAVTKRAGGDGHIMVRPTWRPYLDQINGVTITTPANGQVLTYISSSNTWVNHSIDGFQTTAGLSANVAKLSANNSLYLGGIAANQYAYTNATYSTVSWTNPSPNPGSPFKTTIAAASDVATITIQTGLPGIGGTYVWSFDETKVTFPDNTTQSTAFTGNANNASYLGGIAASQYAYANTIPSLAGYATESYVTTAITNVVGAAPSALDTLKEIADQLASDESAVSSLTTTVAGKVSLTGSYANPDWITSLAYSKLTGTPTIPTVPTNVSAFTNDAGYLTSVTNISGNANNASYLGGVAAAQYAYANSLFAYQTTVGLSANVATMTANNASNLGGVAAGNYAVYGQNANFANVTSTATVSANATTAFVAGIAANSGVALQMPYEGALRNMSNTSSTMYFDTSNGGSAHGYFNFRSSNNFTSIVHMGVSQVTFNSGAAISGQTPYAGRTSFNVGLDTVVTVDNLKYRISNQGGVFPQVASASGSTVDVCYDVLGIVNGATNPAYAQNSGYILLANGTWLSIYSTHGMDGRGDRLTAHITDKNVGKIYRVTFMKTNNNTNTDGYNIIVERII